MAEKNGTADWVKWVAGILITVAMSIGGYSINLNMANEARITKAETELTQMRTELDDIWDKYNIGIDDKETFHVYVIELKMRVKALEDRVDDLKK